MGTTTVNGWLPWTLEHRQRIVVVAGGCVQVKEPQVGDLGEVEGHAPLGHLGRASNRWRRGDVTAAPLQPGA